MMQSDAWSRYRRRGTIALFASLVILAPLLTALATVGTYTFSSGRLSYWIGTETSGVTPRLKRVKKEDISLLRYAYNVIGAENSATRFWTAFTALLGGVLLLLAALIPGQAGRGWFVWGTWLLVGLGLAAMGLDERFQAHEWFSRLVTRPSDVVDDIDWLSSDVALLIYPLAGAAAWWLLRPALREDAVSRRCLLGALGSGVLAVFLDVVIIEQLREYPTEVYVDFIEELAEFETVALLSIVAWRRFVTSLSDLAPTPDHTAA